MRATVPIVTTASHPSTQELELVLIIQHSTGKHVTARGLGATGIQFSWLENNNMYNEVIAAHL